MVQRVFCADCFVIYPSVRSEPSLRGKLTQISALINLVSAFWFQSQFTGTGRTVNRQRVKQYSFDVNIDRTSQLLDSLKKSLRSEERDEDAVLAPRTRNRKEDHMLTSLRRLLDSASSKHLLHNIDVLENHETRTSDF